MDTETLAAFGTPVTQGTADLAMADARLALRDYEDQMAADESTSLIDDDGRRRAIRAAMEASNHLESTILDTLAALGLKDGGVVGLKKGGRIGLIRGGDPDDYVEQKNDDKKDRKLMASGYKLNDFGIDEDATFWMRRPIFYLIDDPELGSFEGDEVRDMIWGGAQGGIVGLKHGGVASVLPKGKEADYRGGGVIPVGSRERADDVPARLSKNEFVMTADAVRAAGGGSINKGAKRMYNLMHNLEARV